METLLKNDLTAHYGQAVSTVTNIIKTTTATYFEIEDDLNQETQIHTAVGSGMAKYRNANGLTVNVINYDKFITSLPEAFKHGKKRCDLIVHTTNQQYFLLNELKDRIPSSKVKKRSIGQLIASLPLIMAVPAISSFVQVHPIKHCCVFNKQSTAPAGITATNAFNRSNTLTAGGLKRSNPFIESYGFELWMYSGNQEYTL